MPETIGLGASSIKLDGPFVAKCHWLPIQHSSEIADALRDWNVFPPAC